MGMCMIHVRTLDRPPAIASPGDGGAHRDPGGGVGLLQDGGEDAHAQKMLHRARVQPERLGVGVLARGLVHHPDVDPEAEALDGKGQPHGPDHVVGC